MMCLLQQGVPMVQCMYTVYNIILLTLMEQAQFSQLVLHTIHRLYLVVDNDIY